MVAASETAALTVLPSLPASPPQKASGWTRVAGVLGAKSGLVTNETLPSPPLPAASPPTLAPGASPPAEAPAPSPSPSTTAPAPLPAAVAQPPGSPALLPTASGCVYFEQDCKCYQEVDTEYEGGDLLTPDGQIMMAPLDLGRCCASCRRVALMRACAWLALMRVEQACANQGNASRGPAAPLLHPPCVQRDGRLCCLHNQGRLLLLQGSHGLDQEAQPGRAQRRGHRKDAAAGSPLIDALVQ